MDPFWTSDPLVLVKPDAILEVIPTQSMPLSERYNALARLTIVIAIVAALVLRKAWPLAIGAAVLLLDWFLYQSKKKTEVLQVQRQQVAPRPQWAMPPDYPPQAASELDQPLPAAPRPLSNWEQFVRGPAENQVNGLSGCEQPGVNPSHSDQFQQRSHPWELSGLPPSDQPMPTSGVNGSLPDLDFSAVPSNFESKRLPKGTGEYTLGTGTAMDSGAVAGRSGRPIQNSGDQLSVRPTALMFQGQNSSPTLEQQQLETSPVAQAVQTSLAQSPYPHTGSPEPIGDPSFLPCKPWHLMNEAEQLNWLSRQKRDGFINRLFDPLDQSLNNRQFFNLPNFNPLQDREQYLSFIANDQSHFKDKFTNWQQKYF